MLSEPVFPPDSRLFNKKPEINDPIRDMHRFIKKGDIQSLISLMRENPFLLNTQDINGCYPQHLIAREGNLQMLIELEQLSPDILHKLDSLGDSVLTYAARSGSLELVHYLLQKKMNPAHKSKLGYLPIHAVYEEKRPEFINGKRTQYPEIFKLLYSKSPNDFNCYSRNASYYAASFGSVEDIRTLPTKTSKVLWNDISLRHQSAKAGNFEVLKELCEKKYKQIESDTLIYYAAQSNNLELFTWVMEKYKFKPEKTYNDLDVMGHAIRYESHNIVNYLLNKKIFQPEHIGDPKRGATILMLAAERGSYCCMREIIKYGADIEKEDRTGKTAMHYAASGGHVRCLKLLYDSGANINKEDRQKFTPIIYAGSNKHKKAFKYLFEIGAELTNHPTMDRGYTGFHYYLELNTGDLSPLKAANFDFFDNVVYHPYLAAILSGNIDNVKELIEMGASYDGVGPFMETPLHYAAKSGNPEMVRFICEKHPGHVNKLDRFSNTPAMLCVQSGNYKALQFLAEADEDLLKKNVNQQNLLFMAALTQNREAFKTVQNLTQLTIDSMVDLFKNTPLHHLAGKNIYFSAFLLEQGVDPEKKNSDKKTVAKKLKDERPYSDSKLTVFDVLLKCYIPSDPVLH